MALTPDAVLETALQILDADGLEGVSMRRVAAVLEVAPGALYHHVTDKQTMLAALVDGILADVPQPLGPWRVALVAWASGLRAVLLAHRDSAELVATVRGFRLGRVDPVRHPATLLAGAGLAESEALGAASTLLYYVLGHVAEEQAREDWLRVHPGETGDPDASAGFDWGLGLVLDGVGAKLFG